MVKRPPDDVVEASFDIIQKLFEKLPEPRRTQVKKMMEGKVGDEFFTAPASSREEFHNCFPGGLALHSLNVVKNLKSLTATLAPGKYPDHVLIFVGLFHDLGKVGDGVNSYYIPNPSEWHRNKGMLYEVNKKCVYMPTSERGLFILQNHGIPVSTDEYLAIRLNDGMYVEENKSYRMKEPELSLLTHWADRWSSEQEKKEVEA